MNQFLVKDLTVTISVVNDQDYFSLTDLAQKFENGSALIVEWMRNKKTIDFLGSWEKRKNPNFNHGEFDLIKNKSGDNMFKLSTKNWVKDTNAIGIRATSGRYGGTYAHKTIALEFCTWLSSDFKLDVLESYEKYIESLNEPITKEWLYNRFLSKEKYPVHTKAIQTYLEPSFTDPIGILYGKEADHLNVAVFGFKHSDWVELNPELAKGNKNQRDYATVPELLTLTSLEVISGTLIEMGLPEEERINHLNKRAKELIEQFTKQNLKLIK